MMKTKVLFLCTHNSARSQMAEAFLKTYGDGQFEAFSAGIEPGTLNPNAVSVMNEVGINISFNSVKDVHDLLDKNLSFDYIITVCDPETASRCPVFPGPGNRVHWPFEDPSGFRGEDEEVLERTRKVRDQIREAVQEFVSEHSDLHS